MIERLRAWLLLVMKVPPEPSPPASEDHVLRIFRAAPNFLRYRTAIWTVTQVGAVLGLFWGFFLVDLFAPRIPSDTVVALLLAAEVLAWMGFLVQLPVGYALLRLDFDMRWYILTDRSLHIREGTISVHEKTITFANIQQITMRQNPLQRLLGITDVTVRTAGGGSVGQGPRQSASGGMHEAFFHGVDNPEEIRSAIRERVRLHKDAGLGDPDDPEPTEASEAPAAVGAARGLLAEVRALRGAIASGA